MMAKIRGIKPETWSDENFVELTPLARLLFIGLWNYACDNGHLEDRSKQIKLRILPADDCNVAELLRELADSGRIQREDGWITIPTLTEHQRIDKRWFHTCDKPGCVKPGAESANPEPETRRGHVEDTTSPRRGHAGSRDDVDVDCDVELMVSGEEEQPPTTAIAVATPRPDVERICQHLADRIEANGAKRPTITKAWRDAARLMVDRDGRDEQEVHGAIDWCQTNEFWRSNVLSLPKLREQYDRLKMQAQRPPVNGRQQETDALFARAMARATAKEQSA